MCGICGFTGSFDANEAVINAMMDRIRHRGPDSSGIHIDNDIALGFRRLSFIDLKDGNQPMFNEDGSIVIVFNGEIYNYQSLREELSNHCFKTKSDTEVLIHAYEEYGENMLHKLRGMFAFVIYDKNKGQIFAARDFFGIKPLYYSVIENNFLFGSEIKCFLEYPMFKKELNENALEYYLSFQYSVLNETFFKGVYKLPPAHYIIYKEGTLTLKRYFEPEFNPERVTLMQTIDKLDEVINDSVEKHKISDVPVGSFLSSGVDSSLIAARGNCDKTFTVGFDYDKYSEIDYAKALSQKIGVDNYNKTITTDEYWEAIPKVQYHMDEPLADPSAVALYFVSQVAREHVKGALSGEGADELFGGYNIYKEPLDLKLITSLPKPLRKFLGRTAALLPFSFKGKNFFIRGSKDISERFIGNANIFNEQEKTQLLKKRTGASPKDITKPLYEKVSSYDDITKMQYIDINLWLVGDILLKADKMSMAHSLEVRVPYLDKEVFKAASGIPVRFRVNKKGTKYAFRLFTKRYLPEAVSGKKKLGFPVPIRIWLRDDKYYNIVRGAFTSDISDKYFNREKLIKLLDDHKGGKKDNSRKIWTVFTFLVWYEQFFKN